MSEEELLKQGWHDWYYSHMFGTEIPYKHEQIEITRKEWNSVRVIRPKDVHPMTNIVGLYWRPYGA